MSLPSFQIGSVPVPGETAVLGLDPGLFEWYSRKSAAPVAGFLGGELLARFRLEVDFPAQSASEKAKLMVWPQFIQFPSDEQLRGRPTLIVDDVWGSGRTITAVKNRVSAAGGFPETCVLHFNPHRNLFGHVRPDYYAAVTDAAACPNLPLPRARTSTKTRTPPCWATMSSSPWRVLYRR